MATRILFFLVFSIAMISDGQSQTRRALIIAIGKYDMEKTRWGQINVDNDVVLITESLKKQDFDERNITILKDQQATKQGIIDALNRLIDSCKKDDIVVVHFSSHGQQLEDDGDDEIDRYDEAIVPYGAIYSSNPVDFVKYKDGYLRDDTFGDKVTQIRNRLGSGGDLLVLMDACHSGTGARGVGVARGAHAPMVSSTFNNSAASESDSRGVFKENTETKLNPDASTFIVISGAQAHELNYETSDDAKKPTGSLSYAFSKAIAKLGANTTYRSLFAAIESVMREKSPKQKPVLEGDGTDRKLFGGRFVKQEPYFTILPANSTKDVVEINGGTVSGVTTGSIISFYDTETNDPKTKTPIIKGKVISAGNFTAKVKLEKLVPDIVKQNPWAFISELSYGSTKINLRVNEKTPGASAQVQNAFRDFKLVSINNKSTDGLLVDTIGTLNAWTFKYAKSGIPFSDETFTLSDTAKMKAILLRYDRFQYLQNLNFNEEGLSAEVELVFLDAAKNIDTAKMRSRQTMTGLNLKVGDAVFLKIKNTGYKRMYINIVDIQPDGVINPILPNKKLKDRNGRLAPIRAEDCMIEKGDSLLLKTLEIKIGKPLGEEMLKVFLSSQMLDLEDILVDNNDAVSRGPGGVLNNMAKVFMTSKPNRNGTRGAGTSVDTDQDGTIFSIGFNIVE